MESSVVVVRLGVVAVAVGFTDCASGSDLSGENARWSILEDEAAKEEEDALVGVPSPLLPSASGEKRVEESRDDVL